MKVLDLFSGIGGFSLGLERAGMQTVAFCEIEPFCRKVLRKHWPDIPIFEDVRTLRAEDVGPVDVICGGYPCQPFSTAGRRRGEEDDRHLWPEFSRLVAELRPTWVIGENVAGHISMGLDDVSSDLEGKGYACRTFVIPACAVGAPHRRYRCWTVANANERRRHGDGVTEKAEPDADAETKRRTPDVADAERVGQSGSRQPFIASDSATERKGKADHGEPISQPGKWCPEPDVGRVAYGISARVDRLGALGNAVVPQIPEMIGRAIMEARQ